MGCGSSTPATKGLDAPPLRRPSISEEQLAKETHFSVDEVYALRSLFKTLSNSIYKDNRIHKNELALALFNSKSGANSLVVDRVFKKFDQTEDNVISFPEFVHAMSVFHPSAPLSEKTDFAFELYDLDGTGRIERSEVRRILKDIIKDNPAVQLSEDQLEEVIEETFQEGDTAGDGVISREEWHALVNENPGVISYMTLDALRELTTKYPSFLNIPRA